MIETGRGGRKRSSKGAACAFHLKFRKQMTLSERGGRILTQELEEGALRNDWTIETNRGLGGEGAGLQFPGWIIRRAQRNFDSENKRNEVIGAV